MKFLSTTITFFVLFRYIKPLLFQYFISYTMLIIDMTYNDHGRHLNANRIHAQTQWRLHNMEMKYNQDWCKRHPPAQNKVAWLTAMTNDDFVVGAVAVGYIIHRLSCHHKLIALVSEGVSANGRDALKKVGYDVRVVEPLDCNWMDRRKGRPERNIGIIGTHMRFHAWNYTNFEKLMYFDADILPLANIDEIFDLDAEFAAAYCAKPGVIDPCFNAGLLLFTPATKTYNDIMNMWSKSSENGCPNDQVLLWHYYADHGRWTPLPYAYNVRRKVYHPLKVYHFACCLTPKPWRLKKPLSREEADKFRGPILKPMDLVTIWWKYFYKALDQYNLKDWWKHMSEHKKIRTGIEH